MSHTISAIIVNYNAGALLRNCVDSLLNSTLDIEIIVVDNASSDSSLDGLSALPQIRIIRNTRNLGFATACNIGVQRATAPYLLFVNPDCYFQPDTMATLLAELQSGARVGMVGGLLVNPDGAEQAGGRRAVPTPWRSFVRAVGLARLADRWPRLFFDFHMHKQPLPDHPIEVEAISGACMMVKCEAVADVGLWDEGYFLHCEDLDWCMRFRRKGWKVMFVPAARVAHVRGWSSRSRPIFVEWHKHKGMVRFYRKFFRHQYPGGLMGLVILGVWLRFGLVVAYHTARRVGGMSGVGSPVISTPPIPVSPVPVSPEPEFLVPMSLGPGPNVSSGKLGSVGVMGATSMVGSSLLPMLAEAGWRVTAFSRRAVGQRGDDVAWRQLPASGLPSSPTSPETSHATPLTAGGGIHSWICVLPIRVMPGYFALLESYGVRRVVVLSSTSRFTKHDSSDPKEQDLARRFVESEECVQAWAESRGVEWVILRPTLIYGLGRDKNIAEIARFIRRFGFFPLLGKANGLRQPVHVADVAGACMAALRSPANRGYNISGGETLTYWEMVARIFTALGRCPRWLNVPLWSFRLAVAMLRRLPRYRLWSAAMVERMNRDMVFDHAEATRDLGFKPRAFQLTAKDMPP